MGLLLQRLYIDNLLSQQLLTIEEIVLQIDRVAGGGLQTMVEFIVEVSYDVAVIIADDEDLIVKRREQDLLYISG